MGTQRCRFYIVPSKLKQAFADGTITEGGPVQDIEADDELFAADEGVEMSAAGLDDSADSADAVALDHMDEMEAMFDDWLVRGPLTGVTARMRAW